MHDFRACELPQKAQLPTHLLTLLLTLLLIMSTLALPAHASESRETSIYSTIGLQMVVLYNDSLFNIVLNTDDGQQLLTIIFRLSEAELSFMQQDASYASMQEAGLRMLGEMDGYTYLMLHVGDAPGNVNKYYAEVLGMDFDSLPEYSPKVHVRNVGGRCLTDDEMIEYYGGLAAKYGDIVARYRNAICFVIDEQHIYTEFSDDISWEPFLITAVPHPKRVEGYPLDSLSKYIENGEYCYDSEKPQYEEKNGFARFFKDALSHFEKERV